MGNEMSISYNIHVTKYQLKIFFNHLKTYFSLQVTQNQAVGQIWSTGHSLSTPNIGDRFKDCGFYFM